MRPSHFWLIKQDRALIAADATESNAFIFDDYEAFDPYLSIPILLLQARDYLLYASLFDILSRKEHKPSEMYQEVYIYIHIDILQLSPWTFTSSTLVFKLSFGKLGLSIMVGNIVFFSLFCLFFSFFVVTFALSEPRWLARGARAVSTRRVAAAAAEKKKWVQPQLFLDVSFPSASSSVEPAPCFWEATEVSSAANSWKLLRRNGLNCYKYIFFLVISVFFFSWFSLLSLYIWKLIYLLGS